MHAELVSPKIDVSLLGSALGKESLAMGVIWQTPRRTEALERTDPTRLIAPALEDGASAYASVTGPAESPIQ
jgi:hypothetical protein